MPPRHLPKLGTSSRLAAFSCQALHTSAGSTCSSSTRVFNRLNDQREYRFSKAIPIKTTDIGDDPQLAPTLTPSPTRRFRPLKCLVNAPTVPLIRASSCSRRVSDRVRDTRLSPSTFTLVFARASHTLAASCTKNVFPVVDSRSKRRMRRTIVAQKKTPHGNDIPSSNLTP